MNIKPVASPNAIQQAPSNAQALRAKAVAAFTQASSPQQEQPVVQNQTQVRPEEMRAIQQPIRQTDNTEAIQEDTTEQPTEAAKPAEDPALSRQFAQLARQEKALRARVQQQQQQEQALRAREQALQARESETTSRTQVDQSKYVSRDMLKNDPLSVLAEAGISYEELTQQLISQQPTDPRVQRTINQLENKIKMLEESNETSKKTYAEQQTQAYQAAVRQITLDTKNLVKSDPSFEAIRATNSVRDVVQLIEETYKKYGDLLTVEEAAQQVEDYLVEEATKLTRLQKIQRKLNTVAPTSANSSAQSAGTQKQQQPMKTLTNATASTRQLSAKERAILAFKGELKP